MKRQRSAGTQDPGSLVKDLPRVGAKTLLYADYVITEGQGSYSRLLNTCSSFVAECGTNGVGTGVAKNDNHDGRTGDRIRIKRIDAKVQIYVDESTISSNGHSEFDIMLLLDRNHNASPTVPANASLFNTGVSGGYLFPNMGNRKRFKCLKSHKMRLYQPPVAMASPTASNRQPTRNYVEMTLDCDIPIDYKYDSTDGDMENITDNNLYLWIQPTMGTSAAISWTASGGIRFYYTS